RLPDYMVPAVFEELEALPLTANRKLDRGALPRPELRIEVDAGAAPRGEVEESLAELWRQVLGIESVPRHASFFALGGHSLALTRLAARIAGGLGAEVPLRELFEHHTLAGQARCIAAARPAAGGRAPSPILRHDDTAGPAPLSFAQQRLWFLDQLNPGTAAFNLAFAFRLRGGLDRQALTRALDDVVERHEVLRSRFPSVEGTPRQVPAAEGRNLLPVIDVSRMGAAAEVLIVGLCEAVARRPFDLERGPLVRAVLFARSATEHTTVVSLHHIVTDGWSNGVLVRDLGELYAARVEGRSPRLEELPLAYADFAAWQRESLGAAVLERELEAWREHLRGWPRELDLPTDRPRPAVASLRGRTEPFTLQTPPASLERLAEAGGTTLFPVLLAAFQVLLHHLTGETRMLVGTDVANRRRRELEGLVGFFVNQLVLTGDLEGDPTFGELVERAKAATVFAQDHQDAPFDRVVDAVGIERRLDRSPLFQVKLILQNTPFEPLRLAGVDLEPLPVEKGIAQQDLVVALWQREGVLEGWANFSTDLFRASTVRGWLGDFDGLLAEVVKEPHCRLERLRQSLVVAGTTPSTAQEPKMKKPSLASFKKSPAAAVATRLVERSLPASGSLPLIFSPTTDGVDLVEWLAGERAAVLADLRSHGALFFRGFGVTEPEYFERFATTVCDSLFDENGEHPHESVSGNVYTPVFYSPANKLLWHNENSFNFRWPGKIIFCSVLPAASGGETPVADSRQVYRAIDPEIRDRFEELGVLYRRNYGRGMGLDWQEVFQTDDRRVVEDYCHENRLSFHWRDDGALRTECLRPAVIEHAATGEKSWFNQAQHWHPACLDPATRQSLTSLFSEEDLPRSCSFGDGSPIPDEFMHHVLEVYARLEAVQPWGAGDVMLLDNVLCAHARNPYQGDRKLLVAMGDMGTFEA
ncbi:MAG: TauD/TfdA family dioxygenase, partial [Acidobacteria bacterium]|nr:TauD/TfdA family dioxygenase [Acidobacteriota bacterium]